MKLSKFFRENSRTLILVFMSLLLVAFLIPDTIQTLGQASRDGRRKLGTAFGQTITTDDVDRANSDIKLLATAGLIGELPREAVLDYYLLMEEAEQLGIRVGKEEVRQMLIQAGVTNAFLENVQRISRRSYDEIYQVMGRWLAVRRLQQFQGLAVVETLPRLKHEYRQRSETAAVKLSVIDAQAFQHLVPEPTEEELQQFFEAHKDQNKAHTESSLNYGYRLPDRVQLEYVTINPDDLLKEITVQAAQVKRYFEENAAHYTKPDPAASQPATPGQQVPQVPMTFDEARERVRADYRRQRAVDIAQGVVNEMLTEAQRGWRITERDEQGFIKPPAEEPVSFQALAEKHGQKYKVDYGVTQLAGADQLRQLSTLGQSVLLQDGRRIPLAQLAFRVKGLLEADPHDGAPVLNLMEPGPLVMLTRPNPLTQRPAPYQAVLFRVTMVAPNAPPASLEEVRAQVVQDWKTSKAFELAKAHAEKLAESARAVGLEAAVEQATELKEVLVAAAPPPADQVGPADESTNPHLKKLKPTAPINVRRSGFVTGIGSIPEAVKAIFALSDTPAPEGLHRVQAFPAASQTPPKWVVAQLEEVKPLYESEFEKTVAARLQQSENPELSRFFSAWLAPEKVRERTGFLQAANP